MSLRWLLYRISNDASNEARSIAMDGVIPIFYGWNYACRLNVEHIFYFYDLRYLSTHASHITDKIPTDENWSIMFETQGFLGFARYHKY